MSVAALTIYDMCKAVDQGMRLPNSLGGEEWRPVGPVQLGGDKMRVVAVTSKHKGDRKKIGEALIKDWAFKGCPCRFCPSSISLLAMRVFGR